MKRTANMLIRKLFSSVRFDTLWKESWQLQPGGQEWPAPGSISEVLVAHRHGHLLMYYLCRPLCSNRRLKKLQQTQDSTQSWLFADSCPKETENHRTQWWKDSTSQSGDASRGCKGRGAHRRLVRGRGWGDRCAEGYVGQHRKVLASQATWEGGQASEGRTPHLRNHLQKLTDLNASPGVHRTAPENSVQLCMPGWSRLPGEKMLSGKILGSVLGKQRQTHNRESQGSWMWGSQQPLMICGHTSQQRASWIAAWGRKDDTPSEMILHMTLEFLLMLTFTLTTWKWNILFEPFFFFFNRIQITARFR